MGGHDPYSSSKGAAELVTAAYARSFFETGASKCSVASVRAGNVIGGGDWAKDRLMADLMRGLMAGEPIVIRQPRAMRPWQHVLDPLAGYLSVAEKVWSTSPAKWEGWNFGPDPGSERTVEEVATLSCRLWGRTDLLRINEIQTRRTRPQCSSSIRLRPAPSSVGPRAGHSRKPWRGLSNGTGAIRRVKLC